MGWIWIETLTTAVVIGTALLLRNFFVFKRAFSPQPVEVRVPRCRRCTYPIVARTGPCPECGQDLELVGIHEPGSGPRAVPTVARTNSALALTLTIIAAWVFLAILAFAPAGEHVRRRSSSTYTPRTLLPRSSSPSAAYVPSIQFNFSGVLGLPADSGTCTVAVRRVGGPEATLTLDAGSRRTKSTTLKSILPDALYDREMIDHLYREAGIDLEDAAVRREADQLAAIVAAALANPGNFGHLLEEGSALNTPGLSRTGGGIVSSQTRVYQLGPFWISHLTLMISLFLLAVAAHHALRPFVRQRYDRARAAELPAGAEFGQPATTSSQVPSSSDHPPR